MPDPEPPSDGQVRVLVVDADDRVRESLTGLLAIGGQVTVVGSAGEPGPALELVRAVEPDVVMVDLRLPDVADGADFLSRLRTLSPRVRVLAMSWSESTRAAALAAGADAFIRKTFRPPDLVAAVVGRDGDSRRAGE